MHVTGGCYCGACRYEAKGEPLLKAQCHCRECQYITGGAENVFMAMPADGFTITAGAPSSFARKDLENPVTRQFCSECGSHLLTRSPRFPTGVIVKVGTMDDPSAYGGPDVAINLCDAQSFHEIPDGVAKYDKRFTG
jgi:hypothetical protein